MSLELANEGDKASRACPATTPACPFPEVEEPVERRYLFRRPKALQNKEHRLLKARQRTQINGRETSDRHCADTKEEGVDVCDVEFPIGGEENPREYQRCDRTFSTKSFSNE